MATEQDLPATPAGPHPLDGIRAEFRADRKLTLREVAAAADVDPDDLAAFFEAADRTRRDRYGSEDVAYARSYRDLVGLLGHDAMVRSSRVRARVLRQLVVSDLAVTGEKLLRPLLDSDADPAEVSELVRTSTLQLLPHITKALERDYHEILEHLLEQQVVADASAAGSNMIDVAIGFVDLVGFTRLSGSVDPDGLRVVLVAFEDLVAREVNASDHVMLVKFIGDAAMLLCTEEDDLIATFLRIVEAEAPGLEDIERRAGIAAGPLDFRDGDYTGPPVNLAARLTDLARPGTVVVDSSMRKRFADDWETSKLPVVRIKGVGTARPRRIRWPEVPDGDDRDL